jgi:hypothetical protein
MPKRTRLSGISLTTLKTVEVLVGGHGAGRIRIIGTSLLGSTGCWERPEQRADDGAVESLLWRLLSSRYVANDLLHLNFGPAYSLVSSYKQACEWLTSCSQARQWALAHAPSQWAGRSCRSCRARWISCYLQFSCHKTATHHCMRSELVLAILLLTEPNQLP